MRSGKRWLNSRHPYNKDVIRTLITVEDVDGPKLGEYIACSAPLHLADGWNYLSRAFDAICRGDRGGAFHLAYYAELRAAISMLAAEGIGIFSGRHIALNGRLEPVRYHERTHKAAWKILSAWSREPGRLARLLDGITVESRSLTSWLADIGVVEPSRQLVAREWLKAWSIDLKVLSSDPEFRNEMSYRPTRIRSRPPKPVNPQLELVNPIFNSWAELEPESGGASAALDLSLLRQALTLAIDQGISGYATYSDALTHLEFKYPAPEMSQRTIAVLNDESHSASEIFSEAAKRNVRGNEATPVLARSLLMLRLASASTAQLLAAADVTKSDLEFWWSPLGTDLGLWSEAADIDTFSELWDEVGGAIDDAEERVEAVQGGATVNNISRILASHVSLTQFTRAPLWLLQID